jgi:plasmid stabilization system protein ParE
MQPFCTRLLLPLNKPLMGNGDLPPYRHVRAGKHIVFYRLTGDKVQVSRILHSAMDFVRHLER